MQVHLRLCLGSLLSLAHSPSNEPDLSRRWWWFAGSSPSRHVDDSARWCPILLALFPADMVLQLPLLVLLLADMSGRTSPFSLTFRSPRSSGEGRALAPRSPSAAEFGSSAGTKIPISSSRESASSRSPSAKIAPLLLLVELLSEVSLSASDGGDSDASGNSAGKPPGPPLSTPPPPPWSAGSAAGDVIPRKIGETPAAGAAAGGRGGGVAAAANERCCRPSAFLVRLGAPPPRRREEAGDRGGIQTPQDLMMGGSMVD